MKFIALKCLGCLLIAGTPSVHAEIEMERFNLGNGSTETKYTCQKPDDLRPDSRLPGYLRLSLKESEVYLPVADIEQVTVNKTGVLVHWQFRRYSPNTGEKISLFVPIRVMSTESVLNRLATLQRDAVGR